MQTKDKEVKQAREEVKSVNKSVAGNNVKLE